MRIHPLEQIKDLPDELRTGHWFNDLQHGMLVVLFRNILVAVRENRPSMVTKVMDVTTAYLYTHFLAEEEGVAFSVSRGGQDAEILALHQSLHLTLLDEWTDQVLEPTRQGRLGGTALRDLVADYYQQVIDHIANTDQDCYGAALERDDINRSEICHLSNSGVPLSPFMPGTLPLVKQMNAKAGRLINPASLPAIAQAEAKPLTLLDLGGADLPNSLRQRVRGKSSWGFKLAA